MVRRAVGVVALFVVWTAVFVAQSSQPQTPVFRAITNLVQLDVSVLDKNRQPVRGLTAADFTVLEDGKPQRLAAFSAVDVPPHASPTASWLDDIAPDVAVNTVPNRRLVVLVIDDKTVAQSLAGIKSAAAAARVVVDNLGPQDLMAVVFSLDNRGAQDFTADRAKLDAAIGRLQPGFGEGSVSSIGGCLCSVCSIDVLARVAEYLRAVPDRRKAIVYLSAGVPVNFADTHSWCGDTLRQAVDEVFRQAQIANANIYPVDVRGLVVRTPDLYDRYGGDLNLEYLQTMAHNTGGTPIINDNFPERVVSRVLTETGSYYIIGYVLSNPTKRGGYRRLEVKVNRKSVEVRTRRMYYEPPQPKRSTDPAPPPAAIALSEILPARDLPLRATFAPFANGRGATVLATVDLEATPIVASSPESIDWKFSAFDPEGRPQESVQRTARVTTRAVEGTVLYSLQSQLDLKPGRHELRFAVHRGESDKSGSVYASLDVPDFASAPLSMSGVAIELQPASGSILGDPIIGIVPVTPTARRDFAASDHVTAFVRVYQGGKPNMADVPVAVTILDVQDRKVFTSGETLAMDSFGTTRATDYRFDLPVSKLTAGEYLLTLDATLGKVTARRDVRFTVR